MNYKDCNDYELIEKIRENDDDSRNVMFQKYQPLIHRITSVYFHKFSSYGYEFEDFLQEANMAFYRALCMYDEKKDNTFFTFVYLCIKRNLASFCRNITCSNKNLSNQYYVDIEECYVEDSSSNVEYCIEENEKSQTIKKYIYELPMDVSSILELRWNGFSYREIGTLLDIAPSTVEFKTRKVKKELRRILNKYSY